MITSYNTLIADVADTLNRTDLTARMPFFVQRAEGNILPRLDPVLEDVEDGLTVTAGVAALPADFKVAVSVARDKWQLDQVTPGRGREIPTGANFMAYTIEGGSLRLWPSGDGEVTLVYKPKVAALTSLNQTNAILSDFPEVYHYGVMAQALGFLQEYDGARLYTEQMFASIAQAEDYYRKQRYGGPLVPKLAV